MLTRRLLRLIQGIIGDLNFWMISAAGKSLWGLINEVIYGADDDEDEMSQ